MENIKEIPEVVGSIIQRSIIPRELSTMLNIIAVPISEFSRMIQGNDTGGGSLFDIFSLIL